MDAELGIPQAEKLSVVPHQINQSTIFDKQKQSISDHNNTTQMTMISNDHSKE